MLPARHQHPLRPRVGQGPHRRAHPRDQPADRPLAARRDRPHRRWARTPSCSTATCCRPTAAPAPPRSPAPTSRSPTRSTWARRQGIAGGRPQPLTGSVAAVSVGIVDGEPRLDLPYDEDVARRDRHERRRDRRRRASSRSRAPPRARRSTARMLDALLDLAAAGLRRAHRACSRARGAGRDVTRRRPRHAQRQEARRARPDPRRSRAGDRGASGSTTCRRRARGRRDRARRSRATRCSRPRAARRPPGCRRSPTTRGLCVDALNGMPGVLSARWAGAAVATRQPRAAARPSSPTSPTSARGAHFACAVALVLPGGARTSCTARCDGRLIRERRGDNGFGYDPIFVPDGETTDDRGDGADEKDAISHRGRALRALAPLLERALRWGRGPSDAGVGPTRVELAHWHGPKPCASANWATAPARKGRRGPPAAGPGAPGHA